MKNLTIIFLVSLTWPFSGNGNEVTEIIRQKIESQEEIPIIAAGSVLYCTNLLPEYYYGQNFKAHWMGHRNAASLVGALRNSYKEGLQPNDYRVEKIDSLLQQINKSPSPEMIADLDLLCTDAYLLYASHLLNGKLDPETRRPVFQADRNESDYDLVQLLKEALANDKVSKTLSYLPPSHDEYKSLRNALASYRRFEQKGGWPMVEEGPVLALDSTSARVTQLRERLIISGDYPVAMDSLHETFDSVLYRAVMNFQQRHGLVPDGKVGNRTLYEMNVPVEERIRQIEINLERWRWLPTKLGSRFILVNIANYELLVIEEKKVVFTTRAIIGKTYRKTPLFNGMMSYLVLNPTWTVPPTILREDVIPAVRKDISYLAKNNMEVLTFSGQVVDPSTIDWQEVNAASFPYMVRQKPGPTNALGQIKFMFPNKHNVYIHDTPSKGLFEPPARAFSSGCIRIENPMELAAYLLKDDDQWPMGKVKSQLNKKDPVTIPLQRHIPVYMEYFTAGTSITGEVYFRNDIYDRDGMVYAGLYATSQ